MKIISKFSENVGLHANHLSSVLNRSWTGLRTAVFSGLSQKLGGPWPLVRLNRLQSGPVLGPIPVLQTRPWSTNIVNWSTKCVFGGQEEVDEWFCSMSLHTDICHIKKGIAVPIQSIRVKWLFYIFKNLKKSDKLRKKNSGVKKNGCDAWLMNWLN